MSEFAVGDKVRMRGVIGGYIYTIIAVDGDNLWLKWDTEYRATVRSADVVAIGIEVGDRVEFRQAFPGDTYVVLGKEQEQNYEVLIARDPEGFLTIMKTQNVRKVD